MKAVSKIILWLVAYLLAGNLQYFVFRDPFMEWIIKQFEIRENKKLYGERIKYRLKYIIKWPMELFKIIKQWAKRKRRKRTCGY